MPQQVPSLELNRLETLVWFLKRPGLYRQMLRSLRSRWNASRNDEASRDLAAHWCRARAVDTPAAIRALAGGDLGEPFSQKFSDDLAVARVRASSCPVRMGGPANLDLLYAAAEAVGATRLLETGVAYGWSSLALLASAANRPGARLVSVDMPYPGYGDEAYVGCVVPPELRANWTLLHRADREGIPLALGRFNGTIDLCHYDSDKSHDGRLFAYRRLWDALREGGILISDDIGDNMAFAEFADTLSGEVIVVADGKKFMGMILKRPDQAA